MSLISVSNTTIVKFVSRVYMMAYIWTVGGNRCSQRKTIYFDHFESKYISRNPSKHVNLVVCHCVNVFAILYYDLLYVYVFVVLQCVVMMFGNLFVLYVKDHNGNKPWCFNGSKSSMIWKVCTVGKINQKKHTQNKAITTKLYSK